MAASLFPQRECEASVMVARRGLVCLGPSLATGLTRAGRVVVANDNVQRAGHGVNVSQSRTLINAAGGYHLPDRGRAVWR